MYRQIPFLRLLIFFVAGIIFAINFGLLFDTNYIAIVQILLLGAILATFFIKFSWTYRWVFGVLVSAFLFVSGVQITLSTHTQSNLTDGKPQIVVATLLEPPEMRTSSVRTSARVTMTIDNGEWNPVNDKVLLYFSANDSLTKNLSYGNVIVLQAAFNAPPEAQNPYQFNYKKHLSKKQIHRVAFVRADSWHVIGNQTSVVKTSAFAMRQNLLNLYKRVGIEGENLAVLSALTMGYKSLLDDETRRVFSASGAMHILAVSGLHVGIVFATMSLLLFFLDRIKNGKVLKTIILVSFLWFFAIFTGLSPSVIRAALMFSLVVVGMAFSRKTNIYNTLSASAFIILAVNPMLITEVGFQLSYLAVLSIVFFYPYIYKAVYIRNKLLDKVWVLVSVSIAAQIGTFALGLFYFNQFPNYFLITNLYAIPLATIIIYLALILIVVSPVTVLAAWFGWLLNSVLSTLTYLIRLTESLPYSTIAGISISTFQLFCLIAAILGVAFFFTYRRPLIAISVLSLLVLFFAERALVKHRQANEQELVVFAQRHSSLVGFRNGNSMVLAVSDTITHDVFKSYAYSLGGYLSNKGIKTNSKKVISLNDTLYYAEDWLLANRNMLGGWFNINGRSVYLPIGNAHRKYGAKKPFDIDVLIITRNTNPCLDSLFELVKPKNLVIDATVPPWIVSNIKDYVFPIGVSLHYVSEQGAFIL